MKCEKLFQKIDDLNAHYLDVLEDVCNIESPTNCKEGVDAVGRYFLDMATKLGWDTDVFKQDISGDCLCITVNPHAKGEPITISGHIDTVHPIGSFGTPATRRDADNMYGPGVMDCKGGVVAGFMAMHALADCGFDSRPLHLIIQSDEENSSITSGKSTIKYMCDKAKDSIAFLNLEGYKKGEAVLERKGILRYRFTVHGKAVHSSHCPRGANSIAEAASKILKLEEMKDPDGLTCNCGVISGGTVANTVAECCSFYADIRFITSDELEYVKQRAKQIADESTIAGCSCDLEEISFRPAMVHSDKNYRLLDKMNEIYVQNGMTALKARRAFGGSDAAYITQCGVACIDSIGTEGHNIHSTNEYISLSSLAESAKRIAAVVYCI